MANPELAESEGADRVFAALRLLQALRASLRRPYSMRDDKQAEAGLSQIRSPASRASSRMSALVSPASSSGAATLCSLRGLLAGAKVALIVQIHAICNRVETAGGAKSFHYFEEFIFTLKAALAVVACVLGTIKFRRGRSLRPEYVVRWRKRAHPSRWVRARLGESAITASIWCPQSVVRRPCQISRINAAGIRHQQAAQPAEPRLQLSWRFSDDSRLVPWDDCKSESSAARSSSAVVETPFEACGSAGGHGVPRFARNDRR
jgi:hypothetical protein